MNRTGKKSRRFRFGFRTFFILFSVTCVGFGYFYQSTVPNKQARLFLERNSVMFDTSSSDTAWQFYSPYPINNQPFGTNTDIPAWQVALLGEDFFQPVVNITLVPPQIENQKFWLEFNKHRYGLRNVEKITIYGCFDDEALATIANLKGLKMLTFVQSRFSELSYERLRELDQVDTLKIESTAGLNYKAIANTKNFRGIVLDDCGTTSEQAEFLREATPKTFFLIDGKTKSE